MTREEAIRAATTRTGGADPAAFIDLCVDLGMLKLDEPKSEDARIAEALGSSFAFDTNKSEMAIFREQLALRGLKIVEK